MSVADDSEYCLEGDSTMDKCIAPGLRLWMLLAMIFGILLFMIIVVCCFMKIRIPRTKREIELMAAKRKFRRQRHTLAGHADERQGDGGLQRSGSRTAKVIVMQSLGVPSSLLQPPTPSDQDCTSCADSCATSDEPPTQPNAPTSASRRHSKDSNKFIDTVV